MQDSLALELIKVLKTIQVKDGKDGFCFPLNNMFTFVSDLEGNIYFYINEEGETTKKLLGNFKGLDGQNGINGINGLSAYEIAQKNGFEGTEIEWLESLKNNSVVSAELSFLNGFTNYGDDYQIFNVKKVNNVVFLGGLVRGGSQGEVIAVLPEGFRPSKRLIFVVKSIGDSGDVAGRIDITANGQVVAEGYFTWVSLDGIQFVVD